MERNKGPNQSNDLCTAQPPPRDAAVSLARFGERDNPKAVSVGEKSALRSNPPQATTARRKRMELPNPTHRYYPSSLDGEMRTTRKRACETLEAHIARVYYPNKKGGDNDESPLLLFGLILTLRPASQNNTHYRQVEEK